MAHIVRPLLHLTRWHGSLYYSSLPSFFIHFDSPSLLSPVNTHCRLFIAGTSIHRSVHFRSRALKLQNPTVDSEIINDSDGDSDSTEKKSRNEKKREARRAVRRAMELAAFSPPQIKRILRVADLDTEVFDAIMLAKRLGRDVREGKRRQFSYIGRLIREVEPDLLDGLIQATKDGDQSKFQGLYGTEIGFTEDDAEEKAESDDEDEDPEDCINTTSRWFDGLINRDIDVSNEIYSLRTVEFDRQELRRLVRDIYTLQKPEADSEEADVEDKALLAAKRSLTRFLRTISKQLPSE